MKFKHRHASASPLFKGTGEREMVYQYTTTPHGGRVYLHSWPTGFRYMTFASHDEAQKYAYEIGAKYQRHHPACATCADGIEAHCTCDSNT